MKQKVDVFRKKVDHSAVAPILRAKTDILQEKKPLPLVVKFRDRKVFIFLVAMNSPT